jgi:DNA invertase Pin-like site-specific DNA recombinase
MGASRHLVSRMTTTKPFAAPDCVVAEFEAGRISERTRDALAAAKARGVKLGGIRPGTITENTRAKEQAAKQSERLRPILSALVA